MHHCILCKCHCGKTLLRRFPSFVKKRIDFGTNYKTSVLGNRCLRQDWFRETFSLQQKRRQLPIKGIFAFALPQPFVNTQRKPVEKMKTRLQCVLPMARKYSFCNHLRHFLFGGPQIDQRGATLREPMSIYYKKPCRNDVVYVACQ